MSYPFPYDLFPYDLWNSSIKKKKGPNALYGLFKIIDGEYLGYVEHSFFMSWEKDKVRIWDIKNANYHLAKNPNAFLIRLTRTNSPILCDWKSRDDKLKNKDLRSLAGRNVSFTPNPNWKHLKPMPVS